MYQFDKNFPVIGDDIVCLVRRRQRLCWDIDLDKALDCDVLSTADTGTWGTRHHHYRTSLAGWTGLQQTQRYLAVLAPV